MLLQEQPRTRTMLPPRLPRTVLLVDDDEAILRLVSLLLRREGYSVLEAADGEAALEVAAEYPGPLHLLVTDEEMPKLNGHALWQRLREHRPEAEVLFMSGGTYEGYLRDNRFVAKPFRSGELLQRIEVLLR